LIQLNEQGQVSGPKTFETHPSYYFIGFSINELQNGEFWVTVVMEASRVGRFPRLVTQGLIILIFKGSEKKDLNNWRPITLLMLPTRFLQKHCNVVFNTC
jgi:hypothetical protein